MEEGDGAGEGAIKKGKWSEEEDEKLRRAVEEYGIQNWVVIERLSGLGRQSKNCRLRWFNHLRPNLKKFPFTQEEEEAILRLHSKYGNSWSLIATELPGRSDNEIKNFWNKRVKKCMKNGLPLYPSTTIRSDSYRTEQSYNSNQTSAGCHVVHSGCIEPAEFQQCMAANTSNYHTIAPLPTSTSSPQTVISIQTSADEPSSILSPSPTSQSPNILKPAQIYSLPQGGDSCMELASFRKPPILDSVKGRFRRWAANTSHPSSLDHSALASSFTTDSFLQIQGSSTMESPRSPFSFKSSPRLQKPYSLDISTKSSQIPVDSFSAVQLKPPTVPPPLGLRLSVPLPLDSYFGAQISFQDSTAEPLASQQMTPSTQPVSFDTYRVAPRHGLTTFSDEENTESNSNIIDALREAQDRVKYLKKKLRQSTISNQKLSGSQASLNPATGVSNTGNLFNISTKLESASSNPQKTVNSKKRKYAQVEGIELKQHEKSETKVSSDENLQRKEDSPRGISMAIADQCDLIDLFDHPSNENTCNNFSNIDSWGSAIRPVQESAGNYYANECPIMEELFRQNMDFVQDSLLMGDFSGVGPIDLQGQVPVRGISVQTENQFQDAATIQATDGTKPSYLQHGEGSMHYGIGHETSDDMSRLCESSLLLPHQYDEDDLPESGFKTSETLFKHAISGDEKLYLPTYSNELQKQCLKMEITLIETRKQDPSHVRSHQESIKSKVMPTQTWKQELSPNLKNSLLIENIWTEESLVTQEHKVLTNGFDSAANSCTLPQLTEFNNRNGGSDHGETGLLKQDEEHNPMDSMSEELSSLLEFFPTTIQTPEWYFNGKAINEGETSQAFDMDLSVIMVNQKI